MSHVHVSFETPEYVANADGTGTLRILEAVKLLGAHTPDTISMEAWHYEAYDNKVPC